MIWEISCDRECKELWVEGLVLISQAKLSKCTIQQEFESDNSTVLLLNHVPLKIDLF